MKNNDISRLDIAGPLIFLRHGKTDWNKAERYQGHTDTKLSPHGESQAQRCAEEIAALLEMRGTAGTDISLVCSPLARARQTTEIIASHLSIDPTTIVNCDALKELSMGRWEGLNSQQVKDRFYEERKSRKLDRWNFKPVGGESLAERRSKVLAILAKLQANTIVVTHSGILRIIHQFLTGSNRSVSTTIPIGHAEVWLWDSDKLHTTGHHHGQG